MASGPQYANFSAAGHADCVSITLNTRAGPFAVNSYPAIAVAKDGCSVSEMAADNRGAVGVTIADGIPADSPNGGTQIALIPNVSENLVAGEVPSDFEDGMSRFPHTIWTRILVPDNDSVYTIFPGVQAMKPLLRWSVMCRLNIRSAEATTGYCRDYPERGASEKLEKRPSGGCFNPGFVVLNRNVS